MRAVTIVALCGIAVLLVSGCGGGDGLADVSGQVTLDGAPLADCQVIFYPLEGDSQRAFAGFTDAEGKYELSEAGAETSGALPGKHRVSLSTAVLTGMVDEFSTTPPEQVPAKYRDGTLQFEVPAGGTSEANFKLEK